MKSFISRRRFLQGTALSVPGLALLGCGRSAPTERDAALHSGPLFLSAEEIAFIDAAVARLIPGDANHPGAKEAGLTKFIDLQLSGPYGRAETWYMQGPWRVGSKEQGYQSKLTPAQMYRTAIEDTQHYCLQKYSRRFETLSDAQRDEVLHGLQNAFIKLPNAPADAFFTTLWHNTQEGFLADPMYGGNRDFAGWKLIGFPGPRYDYVEDIEQYGKPYVEPTVGLQGRGSVPSNGEG